MPYEVLEPEVKGNFTVLEPESSIQNLKPTGLERAKEWSRRNVFEPAVGLAKVPLQVSDKAVGLMGDAVRSVINLPSAVRSLAKGETGEQYKPTLAPGQPIVPPEAVDWALRNINLRGMLEAQRRVLSDVGLPVPVNLDRQVPGPPVPSYLDQVRQGAVGEISQFTTPENVGIGLATMGAGGVAPEMRLLINKIVSATFLSQLLGQAAPEQIQRTIEDPSGQNVGRLGALGLAGLGLGREAVRPLPEVQPTGILPAELRQGSPDFPFVPPRRVFYMEDRPQFQETPPLIGQRPLTVEQQVIQPNAPRPATEPVVAGTAFKGEPKQGGQVSFEGFGVPSAMQGREMVRPPSTYEQAQPLRPPTPSLDLSGIQDAIQKRQIEPPPGTLETAEMKALKGKTLFSGAPIDPDKLRPAIKWGEKLLIGMRGDSHADVLQRNGIDPGSVPHSDARRGFAVEGGKEFYDRQQASQLTGIPGDAAAGGLDSQQLPGAGLAKLQRMMEEQPNAIRELRTDQLPQTQPPGGIQKVGEEIRTGAKEEGVARQGQEVALRERVDQMNVRQLINQYLSRERGTTEQSRKAVFGGRIESLEASDLRAMYDQLEQVHKERVARGQQAPVEKAGEGASRAEQALEVENTLWGKIRERFMRYGLARGENVAKYSRAELEATKKNLQEGLQKKLQPGQEGSMVTSLRQIDDLLKDPRLFSGVPLDIERLERRIKNPDWVYRKFYRSEVPNPEQIEDVGLLRRLKKVVNTPYAEMEYAEKAGFLRAIDDQIEVLGIKNISQDQKIELLKGFQAAAADVSNRTTYGKRQEVVKQPSFLAAWSNAQNSWYASYQKHKPGDSVNLDANEILIPASSHVKASVIAKSLPQLPLYEGSFEAGGMMKRLAADLNPNSVEYKRLAEVVGEENLIMTKTGDITPKLEQFMDRIGFKGVEKERPGTTELFSGVPTLKAAIHQLDVERKAVQFLLSTGHRKNVDKIFSSLDSVDTQTLTFANKAEDHIALEAEKVAGRKNAPSADLSAMAYMAAKGDRANLSALRALVPNHKEALQAIDYASAHWNQAEAVANAALEVDRQNIAMARANGVAIPTLDFYLKQMYKAQDESMLFKGKHSPGIGIGSRLPRAYENIFEAINAGLEPLSLSAKALVGKRTAEIQREINTKNWMESFRRINDPLSGSPLATDMIPRRGNRPSHPPPDYVSVPGLELAVHRNYAPLFEIATGKSILSSSKIANVALETEGLLKHSILAFDFFHLFRLANFGKSIGLGVGYKKGVSMLEYSASDLAEAVRQGHAPPEAITYQNERITVPQGTFTRREIGYLGSKNGANWGRHSEALYTHIIRKVPVLGRFNRFVFDRMSRGMMYEAFQREFERVGNAHPQWTRDQVARNVARDLNFRMGNIGRQGVIKSATMQDITFALALAPRWVESMVQSEIRGTGQVAKALATGKPKSVGTLGYSMGKLVAYYFVGTQALNMLLNDGKSTFDNDNNKGHELDLFIPPLKKGDKGFWVNPLTVPMEVTHDIMRYTRGGMSMGEALAQIAENKLSPLAQGAKTLFTGKDWRGVQQENRFTGAAKTALNPSPLPLRQGIESAKQRSLVPIERQGFSMMGIKAEPETTGQQISRETKGMNIGQRLVDAAKRDKAKKAEPRTLEERTASSVRAIENEAETRKQVNSQLDKADRQWLTSRGLILPGYTASVTLGGQRLKLNETEREHYEKTIVENYKRVLPVLRKLYDTLPEEGQKRLFSTATSQAKKLAEDQLLKEMSNSKSETNQKKRFSILD